MAFKANLMKNDLAGFFEKYPGKKVKNPVFGSNSVLKVYQWAKYLKYSLLRFQNGRGSQNRL